MLKHQKDTLKYEKSRCRWLCIYCHIPSYDVYNCHIPSYDGTDLSYDGISILIQVVRIPDGCTRLLLENSTPSRSSWRGVSRATRCHTVDPPMAGAAVRWENRQRLPSPPSAPRAEVPRTTYVRGARARASQASAHARLHGPASLQDSESQDSESPGPTAGGTRC